MLACQLCGASQTLTRTHLVLPWHHEALCLVHIVVIHQTLLRELHVLPLADPPLAKLGAEVIHLRGGG